MEVIRNKARGPRRFGAENIAETDVCICRRHRGARGVSASASAGDWLISGTSRQNSRGALDSSTAVDVSSTDRRTRRCSRYDSPPARSG
ncbi:hypothetical protein EYF80_001156 [Liparis tanakae]|uniref:Uncharacterized protein n=1 Tax=Liparis tanakae TaxID=230148 RepID=A0A4Z2JEX4_9TELE|nr:hypothetical protein EYF80_001156 [Liparis tanakae]